jgi:ketosteroid isomerase-like protein
MKIPSAGTLVGLAISFTLQSFGQSKDTAELQIVQQRDLLGVASAVDESGEFHRKLDEAYNKNDAAAVAALFTEDALLVEPGGMFSGRQDIAKRYADTFQRSPVISFNSRFERHYLNAIDNAVFGAGQWTSTFQSQNGPLFALGYWLAVYVREGDAWKKIMASLASSRTSCARVAAKTRMVLGFLLYFFPH